MTTDLFDILPRSDEESQHSSTLSQHRRFLKEITTCGQKTSVLTMRRAFNKWIKIRRTWPRPRSLPKHFGKYRRRRLIRAQEAISGRVIDRRATKTREIAAHKQFPHSTNFDAWLLSCWWSLFSLIWNVFHGMGRKQLCFNLDNMPLVGLLFQTYMWFWS